MRSSYIRLLAFTILVGLLAFQGCARQDVDTSESEATTAEVEETAADSFEDGFESGDTERWKSESEDGATYEDGFESGDTQKWQRKSSDDDGGS